MFGRLLCHCDHYTPNGLGGYPTVSFTQVVADQELVSTDLLYQMQQILALPLHQHDIARLDAGGIDWGEGHELPALNPAAHGAAVGPHLNLPAGGEFLHGGVDPPFTILP